MTPNDNLNILPFYSSLEEQNHNKFYTYGEKYALISPKNKFLPFQISTPNTNSGIAVVFLWKPSENSRTDITSEAVSAGMFMKDFSSEGYDLIINNSKLIFPSLEISPGEYYLEVRAGSTIWYSDVFTVLSDLSPYLKLEYWDSESIFYSGGQIDYTEGYRNFCYLQTEIGKPEYPFEEEAQKRDGFIFIEKQISEKKYKFEFIAPEYLCDALRIVRMHDYINIYFKGKKYSVENIIFDPKWEEQGDLAVMQVEFECDTVIKKTGRGRTLQGGDFSSDFSNDFSNDFNNI